MSRTHTVAEIKFGSGQILCSCGALVTATENRPVQLAAAFQDHRREAGERTMTVAQVMGTHRGYS